MSMTMESWQKTHKTEYYYDYGKLGKNLQNRVLLLLVVVVLAAAHGNPQGRNDHNHVSRVGKRNSSITQI